MLKNKPTQCEKIIKYIKDFGYISAFRAFTDLGVTQLGARIYELKQDGYNFITETRKTKNRYGEPVHYKIYKLMEENTNGNSND